LDEAYARISIEFIFIWKKYGTNNEYNLNKRYVHLTPYGS